ncbi:hypothetical protein LUZ60_008980 [Juncus effusus]|nr:hypothetical protein LUZ60_008980 [Juncus effusus]
MNQHHLLLSLLLTTLISTATPHFIVEKNTVKVISPEEIKGEREAAIANYGIPSYGGTLTGVIIYPDSKTTGCNDFGTTFKSKSGRPVILLIDRGDCYFALKSWNAQLAGAGAVLVADNVNEPLLTMDTPNESFETEYVANITIPSAFITHSFAETLKSHLKTSPDKEIVVKIAWPMPHPDARVEYEFWTNSNDECGERCDEQMEFVRNFKGKANLLERGNYTLFTPHYITWYCPEAFVQSKQCNSQCINKGRYCAPDPEGDFGSGYDGKDVVMENLRQLCVHRVANSLGRAWIWWDFVVDYHIRCSMKDQKYSASCAQDVVTSLGLPFDKIKDCMGDPDADKENDVLLTEQIVQVGHGTRGDVTILPTLVINNVQYRGKLESGAVLKAICAGYKEGTEPHVCLTPDMETNDCVENNGGCWQDPKLNVTACKDTYRGRICKCPSVNGVQWQGDGYTSCKAVGPGRCSMNNGGCWTESKDGRTFSACSDSNVNGCKCPTGFTGDGYTCVDINECKEKTACQCEGCSCKNTWGGFDCKCKNDLVYIKGEDTCIGKNMSRVGWFLTILVISCVVGAGIAGYIFYKYRLRSYMDSEIMAIMSQYMPIDNQNVEIATMRDDAQA